MGQGTRGRTCGAWWGQLGVWPSGGGEQRRLGVQGRGGGVGWESLQEKSHVGWTGLRSGCACV